MLKVLVKAPALSMSGYGEQARFLLRSIKDRPDIDLFLVDIPWGKSNKISTFNEESSWLKNLIGRTAVHHEKNKSPDYDISIQVTIPNEWEKAAPVNIGVTAGIETTRVAPVWIEKGNLVDQIITISQFSKYSYANTNYTVTNDQTGQIVNKSFHCTTPIEVVHYPVRQTDVKEINLNLTTDFNFLVNAQWSPRKNLENTISWFIEEFIDQEVGLILKVNIVNNSMIDYRETEMRIKNISKNYPQKKCKIYLLHGDLTAEEMNSLYFHNKIKALISLAHGEGFGLPIFEAAYNGLPVIAPDWSGHIDYLYIPVKDKKGKIKNKPYYSKVDYDIAPVQKEVVWKNVLVEDSMWCYPKQGSYKMRLREVYKDYGRFKSQAEKLKKHICNNFTSEKQYKKVTDIVKSLISNDAEDQEVDALFTQLMAENNK